MAIVPFSPAFFGFAGDYGLVVSAKMTASAYRLRL